MANIAYILMVASTFFQSSNEAKYQSSTAGREFFFGVIPFASDCCKYSDHKIPLDITNVSPNEARIRVQIPYFNNDTYFDLPAGTTKRINLSYNIQRDGTYVEARGVKVTSNYDISVLVSNVFNSGNSIDTYNVLPVTVIGNDYLISSHGSHSAIGRGGMVSVAGVSNHTNVTILNSTHLLRSEVINMFDIFQYLCDQCDLTGVRVISDKNVFVVAGSTYTTILRVPAPFDNYTIMTFSVSEGFHHFFHTDEIKFGRKLKHDNRMCYSCQDLYHVYLCDRVTQCSEQEVCFVERFLESGQRKYETGCLQKSVCEMKQNDSSYSDDLCFKCCDDDYCYNKGCGENDIPARDSRGPICFDCEHVSSPEECTKVIPCDSHQTCRIEEYKWFDQSHFKLGCGHGLCNPTKRTLVQDFKRATPVCRHCCSDDYCNRNCTADPSGQSGSVIVG